MTKQDFEFIAAKIRKSEHFHPDPKIQQAMETQRRTIAMFLADGFKQLNPHFNEQKFMEDCGCA